MNYFIEKQLYKKVSQYSHDAFVHYLLTNHDEIRKIICQIAFKDEKIVSTEIVNSELYGEFNTSKRYVLDVIAKDDKGNIYNIEMQCYSIDDEEMIRFQAYGFRIVDTEIRKGEKYSDAKPVRQIIINASTPIVGLNDYIHCFEMYDVKHGVSMPYSIYDVIIIQLAYLHISDDMSLFDQIMYLLKTGKKCDIMNTEDIIQEVIDMHDKYIKSDEMILAIQRERDEFARKSREIRMRETEERIKEREEKISEDEKKIVEAKNRLAKDIKLVEYDRKLVEEDRKLVEEDKKIVEEDKKIVEEDKKIIEEKKKEIQEKEKELEKLKKSIIEEKKIQDKIMIVEYTLAKFSKDISEEMKSIDDERLTLLKSKIFHFESIEDIKDILYD